MRSIIAFFMLLLVVPLVSAGDAEDLLAKVIEAAAGKAGNLDKVKFSQVRSKGTIDGIKATRDLWLGWPATFRMNIELVAGGEVQKISHAIVDGKGWKQVGGKGKIDMSSEELTTFEDGVYVYWLTTLLPLREKGVTLTPLPPVTLDIGPAVGFRVRAEGKPDVLMYFEKSTNLLVKSAHSTKDLGKKILRELTFGKHREVNGLKIPYEEKEFHNGLLRYTWDIEEVKLLDRLDPAVLKP